MSRTPAQLFFIAIALVPGTTAAAWVLAGARWPRSAAVAALVAGALVAGTGITVRRVAHTHAAYGTMVALVLGVAAVGVAITAFIRKGLH